MKMVLSLLGITSFAVEAGKYILTAEQRAQLAELLGEEKTASFETFLATEKVEGAGDDSEGENGDEAGNEGNQGNDDSSADDQKATAQQLAKLQAENKRLERVAASRLAAINTLSAQSEEEPRGVTVPGAKVVLDPTNNKMLFGINKPMMAIDNKHPYNMRAYASLMAQHGKMLIVDSAESMDYTALKEDLGEYYRIRKQERIQSFLMELPSLEKIFPLESGYQDQAVLVNLFMDEFSQADNTISEFENVVKGGYKFEPEVLRMYDVMFAQTFKNLKALEKSWIGYLNKEGSDTMKWSFIEYILAETAKKLHNERELRRIGGKRINPTLNVPGTAMGAADGLYTFIKKQIEAFKIKPFTDLGTLTASNISAYIYEATGRIPAVFRDSGRCVLYMPSKVQIKRPKLSAFGISMMRTLVYS